MLERFKLPLVDTRLVRCRQKLYKVKMVYSERAGTSEDNNSLPCSEDSMHKEIELVLRALLYAAESNSFPEKLQTQHFAIKCSLRPWKLLSRQIMFKQNKRVLTPHPFIIILDIAAKERSAHYQQRKIIRIDQSHLLKSTPKDVQSTDSRNPKFCSTNDLLSVIDMVSNEAIRGADMRQSRTSSEDADAANGNEKATTSYSRITRHSKRKYPTDTEHETSLSDSEGRSSAKRQQKRKGTESNATNNNVKKYSVSRMSVRVRYESSESDVDSPGRRSTRSNTKSAPNQTTIRKKQETPSTDSNTPSNRRVKTRFPQRQRSTDVEVAVECLPHVSVNLGERIDHQQSSPPSKTRSRRTKKCDNVESQEQLKLKKMSQPSDQVVVKPSEEQTPPPLARRKRVTPSRMSLIGTRITNFIVKPMRTIFQTSKQLDS